jgi:hypothetical protein
VSIKLVFALSLDVKDVSYFSEDGIDWHEFEQSLVSMIRPHDHNLVMHVPKWYMGYSHLIDALSSKRPERLAESEMKAARAIQVDCPTGGKGGLFDAPSAAGQLPYASFNDAPAFFPFVLEGNQFDIEDCYRCAGDDLGLSKNPLNPLAGRMHSLVKKHLEGLLHYEMTGTLQFYCLQRAEFVKIVMDVIAKRF